jgi:hypothetical protein
MDEIIRRNTVPTIKIIPALRVAILLKSRIGQFNFVPSFSAFRALRRLILIPIGISIKPVIINPGKTIYIKSPMYEPPKPKNIFRITNDNMDARLKMANTTPVIEIQFLIDDGSFILFIFCHLQFAILVQVCKKQVIFQASLFIYIISIYG